MTNPNFQPLSEPSSSCSRPKLKDILATLLSESECDDFYSDKDGVDPSYFAPLSGSAPVIATPTSLSTDDCGVSVSEMTFTPFVPRKTKPTLLNIPSIVDATLVDRRLAQLNKVMEELESIDDFWTNPELLLQHSWLNGYRATFLEQKGDILQAADSYSLAVAVYDAAAQINGLTAKSSPHIICFFHLLKRYANVLSDPSIPEEIRDDKRVAELRARINFIRESRKQWGMTNPDQDDEPFAYAKLILKVLCA